MKSSNPTKLKIDRVLQLFRSFKRRVSNLNKPFAVHVEAIFMDEIWKAVFKMAKKHKVSWFLMPPDPAYVNGIFKVKMSKNDEKKIVKRYKILFELGQEIQLHIHLPHPPVYLSTNEQKKLMKAGINWIEKNVGVKPTKLVLGWYYYDKSTTKACKDLGINLVKYNDYYAVHDYGLAAKEKWLI